MTTSGSKCDDQEKVWRYMSFSRFVWLLQKKKLWLSRADLLDDPWEISLAGNQLEHVIARHPITPIDQYHLLEKMPETALQRSERIIKMWRRKAFICCWSASEHESHALWRIYCRSVEGVAVQTTVGRLRESVGSLPVYRVTYEIPGIRRQTPTLPDLVSKKRPAFAYEREVRVVLFDDRKDRPDSEQEVLGYGIDWDPEKNLEQIRIHPEADSSFMETVVALVDLYAPTLKDRVNWSEMNARPPF
ncbi:MAG: hypothetical protein ACYDH2_15620 [Anaerolineaceae bacterium]